MRWVVLAELAAFALLYVWLRPRRAVRLSRVGRARDGAARARGPVRAVVSGPRPDGGARPDGGRALHRRRRCAYGVGASAERRAQILLGILAGCVVVAVLRAPEPLGRRRSGDRAGDDRDARPLQRPRRQPEHDVDAARARGAARGLGVPRVGDTRGKVAAAARVRAARRLDRRVGLARRDPRRVRGHARPRPGARQPAAGRSRSPASPCSSSPPTPRSTQVPQPADKDPILNPEFGARRADRPGRRAVHPAARDRDRLPWPRRGRQAAPPASRRAAG